MTTSDSMSRHMATSGDADDHMAESIDPDSLVVESTDPDSLVVESTDPDGLVVDSESPDEHTGHSEALQHLDQEAPDRGYVAIDGVPSAIALDPTPSAAELLAMRRLERAEAEAAREAYGDMMENDYPRGEARERIVRRRDESMAAYEQAREELEALGR